MRLASVLALTLGTVTLETARAADLKQPTYLPDGWSLSEGLPNEKVRALLQSRDGYLWAGTEAGLARFDGVRFATFTRKTHPEMVNDDCRALAQDFEGALWIGTTGGLLRFTDGVFTRFTAKDGLPPGYISAIRVSRAGTVWFACGSGLCRFKDGLLSPAVLANGGAAENSVTSLAEDDAGTLWIGAGGGLGQLDPKSGEFLFHRAPNSDPVAAVAAFPGGPLWVTTQSGSYQFEKGRWTLASSVESDLNKNPFVAQHWNGGIWNTRANHGLQLHRQGKPVFNSPAAWFSGASFLCMLPDREGNLWMGGNLGLMRWSPRSVLVYGKTAGLVHEDVQAVLETSNGDVWVGTDGGLSRFDAAAAEFHNRDPWPLQQAAPDFGGDHAGFKNFTTTQGLIHNSVRSIAEDDTGALWVGTIRGVSVFREGRFTPFPLPGELDGNKIHVISKSSDGAMWMGSELGLHCWRSQRLTTFTQSSGLSHNHIRALLPARDGSLWVGTFGGGVNRLSWPGAARSPALRRSGSRTDQGDASSDAEPAEAGTPNNDPTSLEVTTITTREGLSSDNAWALHEDSDGTLWIGTDHGLNRLKGGRLASFTVREGLPDDVVNQIVADDLGNLWVGTEHGIFTVSKDDLEAVAERRTAKISCVVYDRSDGMLIENTSGERSQPAACKTKDGKLWFATLTGVVIVDPKTLHRNEVPPLVTIERLTADGQILFDNAGAASLSVDADVSRRAEIAYPGRAPKLEKPTAPVGHSAFHAPHSPLLRLPPGHGRVLEFHYTATGLTAAEKNRFKYRLEGLEKDWTEAGTRRIAYYNGLPPGEYRFRVAACNNHGVWNEAGAAFAFAIEPFFYQTRKFYWICGTTLVGLIGLVFWRERKISSLRGQVALQRQRERLARDIHEKLGAKLTHLALADDPAREGSGEKASIPPASAAIGASANRIAQEAVSDLGDLVWTVDPGCDSLEALIVYLVQFAEELFADGPVRCRFEVPEKLPPVPLSAELRHEALNLLKEILRKIADQKVDEVLVLGVVVEDAAFALFLRCGPKLELTSTLAILNTKLPAVNGSFQLSGGAPGGATMRIRIPRERSHE